MDYKALIESATQVCIKVVIALIVLWIAFSIINNGLLKSATGQNLQDRICQELAR